MKTIKHILTLVALATGLTVSAQTHEKTAVDKQKTPVSKNMRKAKTNEKVKTMPEGQMKTETTPSGEAVQTDPNTNQKTVPAEKEKATVTPAPNSGNETQKLEGNKKVSGSGKEKMKEIKRPVKMESTNKAGK